MGNRQLRINNHQQPEPANGLNKQISKFDIENRDDGTSWKVFFVVAPDGLCYWLGERQN